MKNHCKILASTLSVCTAITATANAADLSVWAVRNYSSASIAGLVSYSVVTNNLKSSITRGEVCELTMNLYKRLTNEEVPEALSSPFTDTDSVAVSQAYCYGIVNGTGDTTFSPDRLVTRQEMAKMIVSTLTASEIRFNIAKETDVSYLSKFDDGDQVYSWAMSPMNTLLDYGIITGASETTLEPLSNMSREQAIVCIDRTYSAFGTQISGEMPDIKLPSGGENINKASFSLEWTCPMKVSVYHVIIKDENGSAAVLKDAIGTKLDVTCDDLAPGTYTAIVGAVLDDGSEVYSLPIDFTYSYVKPTPAPTPVPTPVPTPKPTEVPVISPVLADEIVTPAPKPASSADASANPKIQSIISMAESFLGTPYLWGGTTPAGFDCSGFVQYVYNNNGYKITRTTYTQWDNDGVFVSRYELQPGDLIYFGTEANSPSHVGMYVGNGQMIHAPHTGDVIKYANITSGYYYNNFMGAKRIVK